MELNYRIFICVWIAVDFPSSPSAMMRNRFDEDLQHEKPSNTNQKLIILIHFQSGELKAIS